MKSFLLVEDNPADALLTRLALDETGIDFEMDVADDGEAAMEYLRNAKEPGSESRKPDLILLDLNLPRQDGREVLRAIKSDPELCSIPVVVLSTSHSPDDIDTVYRLHGNCYLVKPGELDDLFAMMRALVDFWVRTAKFPSSDRGTVQPTV